jgi:hypothetical protein
MIRTTRVVLVLALLMPLVFAGVGAPQQKKQNKGPFRLIKIGFPTFGETVTAAAPTGLITCGSCQTNANVYGLIFGPNDDTDTPVATATMNASTTAGAWQLTFAASSTNLPDDNGYLLRIIDAVNNDSQDTAFNINSTSGDATTCLMSPPTPGTMTGQVQTSQNIVQITTMPMITASTKVTTKKVTIGGLVKARNPRTVHGELYQINSTTGAVTVISGKVTRTKGSHKVDIGLEFDNVPVGTYTLRLSAFLPTDFARKDNIEVR